MFKVIVLFAIFLISSVYSDPIKKMKVHFSPEVSVEIHKGISACKREGDDLPKFINMIHTGQYTEDENFKKFMVCTIKTNGYADSEGRFILDKVIAIYPDKERMTEVVNKCNKQTADTVDEVTFETFKCFQRENPYDIYF